MRVLELISSAGHYGAENMLLTLSRALERGGCQVRIGVFHNAHKPNIEIARHAGQLGLSAELIPCRGRVDSAAVRAIVNYIHAQSIDLIHTHGYKADLYGYLAAKDCGVPLIATCHNWPDKNLPLWTYSVLDRLVLRRFPRVAAVSEGVVRALRRLGVKRKKIALIPNGIDLAQFDNARPALEGAIPCGQFVVGMVGRLVRAKGGRDFLEAARLVLKDFPETVFVFVGDGPDREELAARAGHLKIQQKVIFLGRRDDLPGVYASLDVMVQPSLTEGMPLTILEALAARRAVVATPVGAVPQLILPEQTGLLVKTKDVAGLHAAISRMLADGAFRRRLGENGRALVQRGFSSDQMAEKYLALYDELLQQRHTHREPPREAQIRQ
jgi:glycosyltransferase involved in cell wall biosynthesis